MKYYLAIGIQFNDYHLVRKWRHQIAHQDWSRLYKTGVKKKTRSKVTVGLSRYQFLLCALPHFKKWALEPGRGVLAHDPSIWETEAGGWQVWGQTVLNGEFMYYKIHSSYVCISMSFMTLPSAPDIIRCRFSFFLLFLIQQNSSPFLTAELVPTSRMQNTNSCPPWQVYLFWTFCVAVQQHEAISFSLFRLG